MNMTTALATACRCQRRACSTPAGSAAAAASSEARPRPEHGGDPGSPGAAARCRRPGRPRPAAPGRRSPGGPRAGRRGGPRAPGLKRITNGRSQRVGRRRRCGRPPRSSAASDAVLDGPPSRVEDGTQRAERSKQYPCGPLPTICPSGRAARPRPGTGLSQCGETSVCAALWPRSARARYSSTVRTVCDARRRSRPGRRAGCPGW